MSCSQAFMDWLRCLRNTIKRRLSGQASTVRSADVKARKLRRRRKLRHIVRLEVILFLGGQCACCGEFEPMALTVDHVADDGHLERAEHRGADYYRRMLSHPQARERYRVLCYNCHWTSNYYGDCTHQRAERPTVRSELERVQRERAELLECNQDKLVA